MRDIRAVLLLDYCELDDSNKVNQFQVNGSGSRPTPDVTFPGIL